MNGQYNTRQRIVAQQFTVPPPTAAAPATPAQSGAVLFPGNPEIDQQSNLQALFSSLPSSPSSSSYFNLNNPANVQFIDSPSLTQSYDEGRTLFKRSENSTAMRKRLRIKRNNKPITLTATKPAKVNKKRAIYPLEDGSLVDDRNLVDLPGYMYNGLSQFAPHPDFHDSNNPHHDIEDEIREHDREAAEGEVHTVMGFCTACDVEPFMGAVALAWKDAKVHEDHVLKGLSVGSCGDF